MSDDTGSFVSSGPMGLRSDQTGSLGSGATALKDPSGEVLTAQNPVFAAETAKSPIIPKTLPFNALSTERFVIDVNAALERSLQEADSTEEGAASVLLPEVVSPQPEPEPATPPPAALEAPPAAEESASVAPPPVAVAQEPPQSALPLLAQQNTYLPQRIGPPQGSMKRWALLTVVGLGLSLGATAYFRPDIAQRAQTGVSALLRDLFSLKP